MTLDNVTADTNRYQAAIDRADHKDAAVDAIVYNAWDLSDAIGRSTNDQHEKLINLIAEHVQSLPSEIIDHLREIAESRIDHSEDYL